MGFFCLLEKAVLCNRLLSKEEKEEFHFRMQHRYKRPGLAFLLSLFLGWFGVGRFYVGDYTYGAVKCVTSTFLIAISHAALVVLISFWLLDLFFVARQARKKNVQSVKSIVLEILASRDSPDSKAVAGQVGEYDDYVNRWVAHGTKGLNQKQKWDFNHLVRSRYKNPHVALLLAFFLGGFGAGRFYLGHNMYGGIKLFVFFVCGFFSPFFVYLGVFLCLVDLFIIRHHTRQKNFASVKNLVREFSAMRETGLTQKAA